MATTPRAPAGLEARGRKLWRDVHEVAELGPAERLMLEEACRIADRLEVLDGILRGQSDEWLRIVEEAGELSVRIDAPLGEARQQANVLKQLLAALRLPDADAGTRPQRRGARGAYQPKGAGAGVTARPAEGPGLAKVSNLDRARQAAGR